MTKEETVSLRDYIEKRLDAIEKAAQLHTQTVEHSTELAVTTIKEATMLAANALEKRLEGMNEFRAQLNDQVSRFITRSELEDKMNVANATHNEYEHRLQTLEQTKVSISAHEALEKRIQVLETALATLQGRLWAIGVGMTILATVSAGIISIALHYVK